MYRVINDINVFAGESDSFLPSLLWSVERKKLVTAMTDPTRTFLPIVFEVSPGQESGHLTMVHWPQWLELKLD